MSAVEGEPVELPPDTAGSGRAAPTHFRPLWVGATIALLAVLTGCTPFMRDLGQYPGVRDWVDRNVTVREHIGPPMGSAWWTTAVAYPGTIIVDNTCGDGYCWERNAPQPRPYWAVHETGHTLPVPAWFPDAGHPFVTGERWAQCFAAGVTGLTVLGVPDTIYWDCPADLRGQTAGYLQQLGIIQLPRVLEGS